jgi:hypothetical protein
VDDAVGDDRQMEIAPILEPNRTCHFERSGGAAKPRNLCRDGSQASTPDTAAQEISRLRTLRVLRSK